MSEDFSTMTDDELEKLAGQLKGQISALNNKQMALKITMNSGYGALASEYFRWFDMRLAEAITLSGQCLVNWVARDLNDSLNKILKTTGKDYVIAMDTDSLIMDFSGFVKHFFNGELPDNWKGKPEVEFLTAFLDMACQKRFMPLIKESVQKWCDFTNVYVNKLGFERDVIADKALFFKKKRYVLQVRDKEGVRYKEPKIKFTGTEAKRTDKPLLTRTETARSYDIALNRDQEAFLAFLADVKSKFMNGTAEEIGFPRGLNELSKFVTQDGKLSDDLSVPIHATAGWLYNKLLVELKLENKYPRIKDGNKIKFLHLKLPNPYNSHTVGFLDKFPEEFGLHKYIDRDAHYEKAFLSPMRNMAEMIGWYVEKVDTLDEFF